MVRQQTSKTGTQFWDENMQNELVQGRLSGTAFDRYCMVMFAGIAAEALVYGEADGGENDVNLFRSISVLLDPSLSVTRVFQRKKLYAFEYLLIHSKCINQFLFN